MEKSFIWLGVLVGSAAGSYLPTLWGASAFSGVSIFFGSLGGALGLWAGFVLSQRIGE